MRRFAGLWLLLVLGSFGSWAGAARAQAPAGASIAVPVFAADGLGGAVVLDRDWLFHPGDDAGYSAPGLDDTKWLRIDLKRGLDSYGFRGLQYGWYRLHVHLPHGPQGIVFATGRTLGRYQVFANGVEIGSVGDMRRHDLYDKAFITQFPLPASAFTANGEDDLVIALRVSLQLPSYTASHPDSPFRMGESYLGTARELDDAKAAQSFLSFAPYIVNAVPAFITGLVALALFLSIRTHREYLFLALYAFADSVLCVQQLLGWVLPFDLNSNIFGWVVISLVSVTLFEFVRETLELRRTWMLVGLELFPSLAFVLAFPYVEGYLSLRWVSLASIAFAIEVLGLVVLLGNAARRRSEDAWFLLVGLLPTMFAECYDTARTLGAPVPYFLHLGRFSVEYDTVADVLLELALLVFLVNRTVRIARERNRAASELEAARTVQQVLVPEQIPSIAGLTIETAYLPAQEVGGDFFQVLPLASGAMLLVIGDVAGKGMPAAMTVSLLVGALRTLAEGTESPGAVLAGLNRRLQGRGAGFTTCLAMLFSSDRRGVTLASAGHLAPYRNGVELEFGANLPLGLEGDAVFDEETFALTAGDHLTVLTDGVPEAMQRRELFGFARTAALSVRSAEAIAEAARSFGQSDDITVLTVDVARRA